MGHVAHGWINVPVKNNVKEKVLVMKGMKIQENGMGQKNDHETQVKYITQRYFSMSNRYSVLVDENDEDNEDKENEWQGIKINIDVACDMSMFIDDAVSKKWPQELQEYYKDKCV
ncbi:hypothetical protein Tco_0935498 [Tanacetum coccineum]